MLCILEGGFLRFLVVTEAHAKSVEGMVILGLSGPLEKLEQE